MTAQTAAGRRPLWLLMEEKIQGLASDDFSAANLENTIHRTAAALDDAGINVSQNAGNMLALRWAVEARVNAGKPLLDDFSDAVSTLRLEDVSDTYAAAVKIINEVGAVWPRLKEADRKPDIIRIIDKTKLGLLVARAKELGGEPGIRFLIEEDVTPEVIVKELEISDEEFARVNAAVEAERAERARVQALVQETAEKTDEEKVKHLINNDASDDLILELAGIDRGVLDGVKKAMEEELKEKQRLADEEAARKKAEAEGPPLEDIPADQMLEYIESIREILEFSDQENEIRTMCEQSSIPKSLVDVAVSDAARLDELESQAEAG
ncbi:MAG: hypothetical protein JSW50_06820 [Candidatus Latescibacterota bacterium]|nr:MAG: hypothetical protein JSW50_06820 [Candidatus Latescibacterota bacterium]